MDGKRLANVSFGRTVKIWDVQTGQEISSFKGTHTRSIGSLVFSPDAKRLVGSGSGALNVWDSQTGQELLTLNDGGRGGRLYFSPDGHRLTSVRWDGTIKIYDATPLPEKP